MMNGQTGKRANGQSKDAPPAGFRGQLLWRKAQDFAEHVAELVIALPHDRVADTIANQLLCSATSISANIAEGYGRFSQAAYRNHLSIARGSAFEVESWLDLLIRRGYLEGSEGDSLLNACFEVQKLLTLRMKSLSEGKSYAVKEEEVTYEA